MPKKSSTITARISAVTKTAFYKRVKKEGLEPSEVLRYLVEGFNAGDIIVHQPTAKENPNVN